MNRRTLLSSVVALFTLPIERTSLDSPLKRQLSVGDVDELLYGIPLDIVQKVAIKNRLFEKCLMEGGELQRTHSVSDPTT